MIGLILLALLLVLAGNTWLLVAMFRVSVWWGIFGLLFPPVQWLFVFLYWGKAWRPLLLQLLAFGLLVFALLNSPDLEIQEYWEQATQQMSGMI
jgi:hypothetical protein